MTLQIGNAAAPRWFDCSLERLDEYVRFLQTCGATSTELVLHHGPADERIARVHVLQEEWHPVFERFRSAGIVCHVHAPLDARFAFDRWLDFQSAFQSEWHPVLRAVAEFTERQGEPSTLVVHAASGASERYASATAEGLLWLIESIDRDIHGARIALELRRPVSPDDARFDRHRAKLASFVSGLGEDRIGICWDIANDWQAACLREGAMTVPEPAFLQLVNHVHLHDADSTALMAHYPLSLERVPWRPSLHALVRHGFDGAVTMEIRYRHALDQGEPWQVLRDSYARVRAFLSDLDRGQSQQ